MSEKRPTDANLSGSKKTSKRRTSRYRKAPGPATGDGQEARAWISSYCFKPTRKAAKMIADTTM